MLLLLSPGLIISCSSGDPEPNPLNNGVSTGGDAAVGDGDGDGVATGGDMGSGGVTAGTGSVPGAGGVVSGTGNAPGSGGTPGGTGGATVVVNCTDDRPMNSDSPEASCADWLDWGECESPWFKDQDACNETCGRCSGDVGGTGGSDGGSGGNSNGTGGSYGDYTLPDLQGGSDGWASRYWDCCKPSCGWTANASNPVDSCDINDNNIGVDDGAKNGCEGGGSAFTCHDWAPWAKSDTVSFGFAAHNGAPCGTCFQVRFSGSSHNGEGTPGLEGKQMIVQVTNIGGIDQNQFDILIPGGGVGDFDGCSNQWNAAGQLGERFGGFRTTCGADANCIRNMCEAAFGDKPHLMDGCDWYINWFQMADNPNIRYQQVDCPQEILDRSGG